MPCHVPATDLTSDTATGVKGPTLTQPTNETANTEKIVAVKAILSDRALVGLIVSLLLFELSA
jgi:hypothetical protein